MRETLINNFFKISKIPRASGEEEKIANFFMQVAKENNFYCFKDNYNNVLIRKKGNIEGAPIALQAHLDMVCVQKSESIRDLKKDGIEVQIAGDKVFAKDSSLGADQGVGLAMMLTILEDKNLVHPDLEFLFTVEEETTFQGAVMFPYKKVSSKRIINLDNAKDDSIFVGADGDICNAYSFYGEFIENKLPSYKILIDHFPGGNSGEEISLSSTNAITTMASLLQGKEILLKSIIGGTSENDLATFCEVVLNTNLDVYKLFEKYDAKIEKISNTFVFSKINTEKIINQILQLPCGYISENMASANLGMIETIQNVVKIYYVFRSMDNDEMEDINSKCKNLQNDFVVQEIYRDPIWKVDNTSLLLKQYKELYFQEYREYPKEEICHSAIECSTIKNRIEGLDIISIGSNIEKFHTLEEVTYISSWLKVYYLLVKFLETVNC